SAKARIASSGWMMPFTTSGPGHSLRTRSIVSQAKPPFNSRDEQALTSAFDADGPAYARKFSGHGVPWRNTSSAQSGEVATSTTVRQFGLNGTARLLRQSCGRLARTG